MTQRGAFFFFNHLIHLCTSDNLAGVWCFLFPGFNLNSLSISAGYGTWWEAVISCENELTNEMVFTVIRVCVCIYPSV